VGGAASSSSLEGTSKTLVLVLGADGRDLEGDIRGMLFSFLGSAGAMLEDLDGKDSLCFLSGACDCESKL
jgi:hypothetical protein